jgi:putative ABC transport system ATP-binding protein
VPSLLEARELGRCLPPEETWLLRDVSLAINAGDRVAVVGPTGSGKTVLLRALALLDPLDAGEIRWRDQPLADSAIPDFRRQVVYLHQRPVLWEESVEADLRLPYELKVHARKQFDRDRVVALFEHVGRDASFLEKPARDLSGGEGQLVALIRAMQLDPSILLLDEPTAALDSGTSRSIEQLVARWFEESSADRAYLWISHDSEQVGRVAQQVYQIKAGRLQRA